jgi:glycosyltransferase involved in cell wall biosynthesis
VGGIPDVVDDDCGLLVAPRDVRALADAIAVALDRVWDEEVLRSRGPSSWEKSGAELFALLESVARGAAGAGGAPATSVGRGRRLTRLRPNP